MRRIDSSALEFMTKMLGLGGPPDPETILDDGRIDQVIDLAPVIRRSLTLAGSGGGIMYAVMENVHSAADSEISTLFPYQPGALRVLNAFTNPLPDTFDIWLIAAALQQTSGTGTVEALMTVELPDQTQAMGVDDGGTVVTQADMEFPLAFWDTLRTENLVFGQSDNGEIYKKLNMRLARSQSATSLQFYTTSSAASEYQLLLLLGVFPVGWGQDVQV